MVLTRDANDTLLVLFCFGVFCVLVATTRNEESCAVNYTLKLDIAKATLIAGMASVSTIPLVWIAAFLNDGKRFGQRTTMCAATALNWLTMVSTTMALAWMGITLFTLLQPSSVACLRSGDRIAMFAVLALVVEMVVALFILVVFPTPVQPDRTSPA